MHDDYALELISQPMVSTPGSKTNLTYLFDLRIAP